MTIIRVKQCSFVIILCATCVIGCTPQHGQQPAVRTINPTPAGSNRIQPAPITSPQAMNPGGDIIATIDDIAITRQQLEKPLFEGYGINMLAKVAQRELAHREARKLGLTVGADQVQAELQRYLSSLFNEEKDPVLRRLNGELEKAQAAKDVAGIDRIRRDLEQERNRLLDQLLAQQKLSRADFDLFIETNTYLRAIAESQVAKQPITDQALNAAFNHLYGEKAQVLDIQLANLQEANEAKRRLATDPFEQVAHDMSRDPQSAALGGELPPFSRDTPGLPQQFKDVAFGLKIGEVSDAVAADGSYHIIMLKNLIPPNKLIKFADVKDAVREFLVQRQIEGLVKEMRGTLQTQVLTTMKINEPILHDQFIAQSTRRNEELHDKTDIRRELDRRLQEDKQATTKPTTGQATGLMPRPTAAPTTRPSR